MKFVMTALSRKTWGPKSNHFPCYILSGKFCTAWLANVDAWMILHIIVIIIHHEYWGVLYKSVCTVEHMWFTLHILILGKMFSNIIFGISKNDYLRIFCATTTFFMKLEGQSNSQFRELSISIYLTINKTFFLMRYWCGFFVSTLQFATSYKMHSQHRAQSLWFTDISFPPWS